MLHASRRVLLRRNKYTESVTELWLYCYSYVNCDESVGNVTDGTRLHD
jgi:hypothetical protein